jgi:hypothetical protein
LEVTVIWDMKPCSLIDVFMSVRPHVPEGCNFHELSWNIMFEIAPTIC